MPSNCSKCGSDNVAANGSCRPCRAAYMRGWMARNRERVRATASASRERNREAICERNRANYDRERNTEASRRYRLKNLDRIKAYKRGLYLKNRDAVLAQTKRDAQVRRESDPEMFKAKNRARARRHREKDWVRTNDKISTRIRQCLKGSKYRRRWESLVGYTLGELTEHLKRTIPSGFTWQDYVDARLELDHIRPVCSFDINSASDHAFKECWSLKNLQLLPALENNRKSGRYSFAA